MTILAPLSPGELIDKISILRIKSERIVGAGKLAHIHAELAALESARKESSIESSPMLDLLEHELRAVNERLWQTEDDIRRYERDRDFGPAFVELARSVYRHNDQRAALKLQINELLEAEFLEQKQYGVGKSARFH